MIEEIDYYLTYEYETCFDDGGIGHDSGWNKARVRLNVKNDLQARREARKIVDAPATPCNGSFCNNQGRHRFISLERVVTTKRQISLPKQRAKKVAS